MSNFASRLDFEQRRRACELEDEIDGESAYEIAAEIIWRRDQMNDKPKPQCCCPPEKIPGFKNPYCPAHK